MACRLYLITPSQIDLPKFIEHTKAAFDGGDVACLQLRLKNATDNEILKAAEKLLPICHEHEAAFIMNDRADLAVQCGADGVHFGQDDLATFPLPPAGEGQGGGESFEEHSHELSPPSNSPRKQGENSDPIAAIRNIIGPERIIGVSCHDSRHLAMEAGEQGADYVAFGAFYPTKSKSPEKLAKYGTPTADLVSWWQETTILPSVAIGGMTPANCVPLVKAGADFIAAITYIWEHEKGARQAVAEFNEAIEKAKQ